MATTHPAHLTAKDRLIVALDFPDAASALALADRLEGSVRWLKVGLELYIAAGPSIIESLHKRGHSIFLDLKLHDIPNTVAGAVRSASSLGVGMLTLHAAGGPAMLAAAHSELARHNSPPQLLAVTVLTSIDAAQLEATGLSRTPAAQVELLAQLGLASGINGFVCSPEEVGKLRQLTGPAGILVTPGIRPAGSELGDQKRTATAPQALNAGASYLVVGRPITQAKNPLEVVRGILNEINP
jgi:orotidine-5'-phosphate decarboxylase